MDMNTVMQRALERREWKNKKILLICPMGIRTKAVAETLRAKSIVAYSMRGGTTEWSHRNLPRFRPEICRT